jgi:uroporphyrinogen-III synthase
MFVLITRQLKQSEKFSSLLIKEGIENYIFPVLCIKNIKPNINDIRNLKESNLIIFTSQNSVTSLMKDLSPNELYGKKIAVIGKATEKILKNININSDIVPKSDFTSESLLHEIKKNKIKNKKIIIIKGIGGRDFLHKELSKNNILFNDVAVYERYLPNNITKIPPQIWSNISHICVTSTDILENLIKACDILKLEILENIIFVSGNKRIKNKIKEFFPKNKILVSLNPTNEEMLKTIIN